ncbi:hypothetical protein T11_12223 [Trichinella zimbabwensis]|uniref:Uncharacterized protein n=1 Tax=Trichinella zimbabwensis TaxID=268475 RepID=A0A0V1HDE0_9BILA|nr:hypothetical protein T11_12223 [Trichinella zimbabwensis]
MKTAIKTVKGVAKLSQDHSKRIQDRAGFVDPVVSFDRPITRLPAKLVRSRKNRSITIGRFCFLVQPVSTSFTKPSDAAIFHAAQQQFCHYIHTNI